MTVAGDQGPRDPKAPIEARFVRQGRRSTRMMWVMATSLGLIAVIMVAIWAAKLGPGASDMGRVTHADARLWHQGIPTAKQTPAQSPEGGGSAQ